MFIITELFSYMSSIDIRDRPLTFWDGGMFSIRDNFFKNHTKQNYRLFFNGCKIGNVSSNLTTRRRSINAVETIFFTGQETYI